MEIHLLKILRFTFFGLNVLITMTGIALMALSARSIVQRQEYRKESETSKFLVDNENNATLKMLVMAMVISILLVCLSLIGFCAALGDKKCLLSYVRIRIRKPLYLVFALLNLALVILGGIVVLRFSKIPQNTLNERMADYRYNQTSRNVVDKIRKRLRCCLVHNIYNVDELISGIENQMVTASCCISPEQEKCHQLLRGHSSQLARWDSINGIVHTEGCITQIAEMSEGVSEFILPLFIVIGFIDLTATLLSTALCCTI